MKVLALHGKQQNAEVFKTRLGRWLPKVRKDGIADFFFIDAPFVLDLHSGDEVPMRTWFHRETAPTNADMTLIVPDSLERLISYLREIWVKEGPFYGICGFSMGGTVAALLAAMPGLFPGLGFIVVAGAPDFPPSLSDTLSALGLPPLMIPPTLSSMHLMGKADKIVDIASSAALALRFTNPITIEHDMGHIFPTKASFYTQYNTFLLDRKNQASNSSLFLAAAAAPSEGPPVNHRAADDLSFTALVSNQENSYPQSHPQSTKATMNYSCYSDEIACLQREELEVLESIYPDELSMEEGSVAPGAAGDPCPKFSVRLDPSTCGDGCPAKWLEQISLRFHFADRYPLQELPHFEVATGNLSLFDGYSGGISSALIEHIVKELASDGCGEACVMTCVQLANEWFGSGQWKQATVKDKRPQVSPDPNTAQAVAAESLTKKGGSNVETRPTPIASLSTMLGSGEGAVLMKAVDAQKEESDEDASIYAKIATEEACAVAYKMRNVRSGFASNTKHVKTAGGKNNSYGGSSSASTSANGVTGAAHSMVAVEAALAFLGEEGTTTPAMLPPSSARGVWSYTVGLVGKPSAGKSTFFNAVTRATLERGGRLMADVAPHPFTTIEPNIGPGWYASPDEDCCAAPSAAPIAVANLSKSNPAVGVVGSALTGSTATPEDGLRATEQVRLPLHGRVSQFREEGRRAMLRALSEEPPKYASPPLSMSSLDCLKNSSGALAAAAFDRRRLLPVCIKDVAGLVPGAYKGRGKGNRFLADLCDADVLVHVVDVTGKADRDGNIVMMAESGSDKRSGGSGGGDVGSNPNEDAEWIRQELHRWIHGNIRAKWASVQAKGGVSGIGKGQQGLKLQPAALSKSRERVLSLFSGYQGPRWLVEAAARRANLNLDTAAGWSALDIHRLVAHFLSIRFPICLALNKTDELIANEHLKRRGNPTTFDRPPPPEAAAGAPGIAAGVSSVNSSANSAMEVIEHCQAAAIARGEVAVPISARAECFILALQSADPAKLPCKGSPQWESEMAALRCVMEAFGTTGVLEAISAAVALKPPVLCYPVCSLETEYPVGWTAGKTLVANPHQQEHRRPIVGGADMSGRKVGGGISEGVQQNFVPRLQDCIQFKPGSTVGDVYEALKRGVLSHATVTGEFVRAEGRPLLLTHTAPSGMVPSLSPTALAAPPAEHTDSQQQQRVGKAVIQLKKDTFLDASNCVLRIQTNRKSVWQADAAAVAGKHAAAATATAAATQGKVEG